MLWINTWRSCTNHLILHITVIGTWWFLLDAYSMLRWLVHDYYTWNVWLRLWGECIEMNSLLVHGITRCSYCMLRLVQGNDIAIYTYDIQQIHITFYWVSKCIYTVYSQSILTDIWQLYRRHFAWSIFFMLQVSTWW